MLELEEESIPGWWAETISRDSHVGISTFLNVVTNLLNAFKHAIGAANNNFNCYVFSWSSLCLFGKGQENESNHLNNSNNEWAKSDGSNVVEIGEFESKLDVGLTISFLVWVKIVCGCSYHNNEAWLCLEECTNPKNSKNHEHHDLENLLLLFIT